MVNKELLNELQLDDLQEQHRELAEVIGIEALVKLSEYYGGTQRYIPQMFELSKELIFRKISEEYNGGNLQRLAVKYGVSESTVYRIVKEKIAEKRTAPIDGQLMLEL